MIVFPITIGENKIVGCNQRGEIFIQHSMPINQKRGTKEISSVWLADSEVKKAVKYLPVVLAKAKRLRAKKKKVKR